MSYQLWFSFFLACWVISISPGAGAIASMSNGISFGFKYGYWNVIGLQIALCLQILIVASGVGVVVVTTPWAFLLIKWFGIIYLIYLAYKQWTAPTKNIEIQQNKNELKPIHLMILNGFLINITNPKAIVFLLAVLPQFLDTSRPLYLQYLTMAGTMITVDMIVMAGYTGLASKILRLMTSKKQQKYMNRTFASLFCCAALLLSLIK
ncbi:LysE family transporter [Acinetobacter nectaris]|uniref:LysE family transporter n=1 Tax=Acinetobacter nectaris TaxID=1219382 RepID=UPI001F00D563|nr:LysE family transporter [Acinetobacter nectaris]MCF9000165.1 LysE family transporter [Acinetobacter nectaris]MCF9028323.1 LysE family transporter [Acinetobacter nectaris]